MNADDAEKVTYVSMLVSFSHATLQSLTYDQTAQRTDTLLIGTWFILDLWLPAA